MRTKKHLSVSSQLRALSEVAKENDSLDESFKVGVVLPKKEKKK